MMCIVALKICMPNWVPLFNFHLVQVEKLMYHVILYLPSKRPCMYNWWVLAAPSAITLLLTHRRRNQVQYVYALFDVSYFRAVGWRLDGVDAIGGTTTPPNLVGGASHDRISWSDQMIQIQPLNCSVACTRVARPRAGIRRRCVPTCQRTWILAAAAAVAVAGQDKHVRRRRRGDRSFPRRQQRKFEIQLSIAYSSVVSSYDSSPVFLYALGLWFTLLIECRIPTLATWQSFFC